MEIEHEGGASVFDPLSQGGDIVEVLTDGIVVGHIVGCFPLWVDEESNAEGIPPAIVDEPLHQVADLRAIDIPIAGAIALILRQHRDVAAHISLGMQGEACSKKKERERMFHNPSHLKEAIKTSITLDGCPSGVKAPMS